MAKKRKKSASSTPYDDGNIIARYPHRQVGSLGGPDNHTGSRQWTSWGEFESAVLVGHCGDVRGQELQPGPYACMVDGKPRSYTADTKLSLVPGSLFSELLGEVKPLAFLLRDDSLGEYSQIARSLYAQGHSLRFLTEEQLAQEPRWSNALLLRRYMGSPLSEEKLGTVLARLSTGPRSVGELLDEFPHIQRAEIYSFIAQREISIDWNAPVESNTAAVSLPGAPFGHLTHDQILTSGEHVDLLEELAMGRRPSDQRRLANARFSCRRHRHDSHVDFAGGLYDREPFRSRATDNGSHENAVGRDGSGPGSPHPGEDDPVQEAS